MQWTGAVARRTFDVAVSAAGLLLALPLLALAAIAITLSSPGPVLFRQTRVGRGGRPFTLHKLRSMRTGSDGIPLTASGDERLTPVGRFLRKLKLDELPQLWNVLRGEMSLVGPRPEVPYFVDSGDARWQEILAVRPGLTDPVTLVLRDEEELLARAPGDRETFYRTNLQPLKLQGYVSYLRRRTFWGDVSILLNTVLAVAAPRRSNSSLSEFEVLLQKQRVDLTSPF